MDLAVIFKTALLLSIAFLPKKMNAQNIDSTAQLNAAIQLLEAKYLTDSLGNDSFKIDTLVPEKFVGYDKKIFLNSKKNIRNSLLFSQNPPFRKNMSNWVVFIWAIFICLIIIVFKKSFPTQFYLINRAAFSNLSFREFYDTQTDVFKGSKLFAWFIISQIFALGLFIVLKLSFKLLFTNDLYLILYVSIGTIFIFILNQNLKSLFSLAFQQPTLNKDYAIIFRTQSFIIAIILLPVLLFIYYTNNIEYQKLTGFFIIVFLLIIYASSILKFTFSGLFSERQSSIFLILYLCAFEILPILVLVKSVNNLLFNG